MPSGVHGASAGRSICMKQSIDKFDDFSNIHIEDFEENEQHPDNDEVDKFSQMLGYDRRASLFKRPQSSFGAYALANSPEPKKAEKPESDELENWTKEALEETEKREEL